MGTGNATQTCFAECWNSILTSNVMHSQATPDITSHIILPYNHQIWNTQSLHFGWQLNWLHIWSVTYSGVLSLSRDGQLPLFLNDKLYISPLWTVFGLLLKDVLFLTELILILTVHYIPSSQFIFYHDIYPWERDGKYEHHKHLEGCLI